jgi:hypothetical protein
MTDLSQQNKKISENKQTDNNLSLAQERIIARSDGTRGKEIVCLDRVNHLTHEPVRSFYNETNNNVETKGIKDYRVEAAEPFRITDIKFPVYSPDQTKQVPEPTYKKIVLIDSTTEDLRIGAYA